MRYCILYRDADGNGLIVELPTADDALIWLIEHHDEVNAPTLTMLAEPGPGQLR